MTTDASEQPPNLHEFNLNSAEDNIYYVPHKVYGWLPAKLTQDVTPSSTHAHFRTTCRAGEHWKESTVIPPPKKGQDVEDPFEVDVSIKLTRNTALHRANVVEEADMARLPYLHEAAVLYNLKSRLYARKPYTHVSDILVAMNPYCWIDGLYDVKKLEQYVRTFVTGEEIHDPNSSTSNLTGGVMLEPHLFETSCRAFRGLALEGRDQSILVSGESGAGKTESVKLIMDNLAHIGALCSPNAEANQAKSELEISVQEQVLRSNFIFEAFGNATTVRNDNSSRFSKFTKLKFCAHAGSADTQNIAASACRLVGSTTQTYVLEKSRVVQHNNSGRLRERNFHIFYQLLAADEKFKRSVWSELGDCDNESFRYIGYTTIHSIGGGDSAATDEELFAKTLDALKSVGLNGESLRTLLRAVCIVLQLGNIGLESDPHDVDRSVVTTPDELKLLAELAGIPAEEIVHALTYRTVRARGETFQVPLKADEASYSRDALAKGIYSNVFDYLVSVINQVTHADTNDDEEEKKHDSVRYGVISILDVFGFEQFEVNRFEQLCINYANEKLQLKYTMDNFRDVQQEYISEGIDHLVDFSDIKVTGVVDLVEHKIGLITILNEECVRPNATTRTFVLKLKRFNSDRACLINNKLAPPNEFGIRHYADDVTYDAHNFIVRNKDAMADDLVDCASKSTNDLVSRMAQRMVAGGRGRKKFSGQQRGWMVAQTVLKKFQNQLRDLFRDIEQTKTLYVRCIKPNDARLPLKIDHAMTLNQLKSAGLVTSLRSAKMFFSDKVEKGMFEQQFGCVYRQFEDMSGVKDVGLDAVMEMLLQKYRDSSFFLPQSKSKCKPQSNNDEEAKGDFGDHYYAIGNSKIYLKGGFASYLESERVRLLDESATKIQAWTRGLLAKTRYHKSRTHIIRFQALVRCWIAVVRLKTCRKSIVKIQSMARAKIAKGVVHNQRKNRAACIIQAKWRSRCMWLQLAKKMKAVRVIQTFVHRCLNNQNMRTSMVSIVEDARKDARMVNFLEMGMDGDRDERLTEALELIQMCRNDLYKQRTMNSKLRCEKANLEKETIQLNVMLTNANVSHSVAVNEMERMKEEQKQCNEAIKILKGEKKSLKIAVKDMTLALSDIAKKAEEQEDLSCEKHANEIELLKKKIEDMKIKHESENIILSKKHRRRENELKNEITELRKNFDAEEETYAESIASMLNIVSKEDTRGSTKGNEPVGVTSSELQSLRDEVKQMKMDHAIKMEQTERDFFQWKQDYMQECENEKNKKKKFFFGLF